MQVHVCQKYMLYVNTSPVNAMYIYACGKNAVGVTLGMRTKCKFMFVKSTCCTSTLLQRMQCIFMLVERMQWVLRWVREQRASSCLSKEPILC